MTFYFFDKLKAATMRLGHFLNIVLLLILVCDTAGTHASERIVSLKEIRTQGIVMQQWESSCAAASVATVLTYGFHDAVSERYAAAQMLKLTEPLKVRVRGGFSMLDMKHFVVSRGYKAEAYKGLAFDDLRLFHAPIVPINVFGYNHYVVFNGVRDGQVLLADPAFGNRKTTIDRFLQVWLDGIAFVISKQE